MFCQNCGKEIDEKAVICVSCGVATSNLSNITGNSKEASQKNGKGIASMILGIVAVVYSLIGLLGVEVIMSELPEIRNLGEKIATILGFVVVQLTLAIVAVSLAYSERRTHKTGFNTSGFWLSICTFILCIISVIISLTY